MLTREMSRRVKNSLASVVGLLRVQARNAQWEDVQTALKDAASRITTIAQVHDHLWRSTQVGFVDIADFAGEPCHKLQEISLGHAIRCKFGPLMTSADTATPRPAHQRACHHRQARLPWKSIYRGKRLVLISASKYRIKASGFRKTSTSMNSGRAGSRSLRPASDLTRLSLRNAHPASLAGDGYLFPSPRYKV